MACKYGVEKKEDKLHTSDITQYGEQLRCLHEYSTLYTYTI